LWLVVIVLWRRAVTVCCWLGRTGVKLTRGRCNALVVGPLFVGRLVGRSLLFASFLFAFAWFAIAALLGVAEHCIGLSLVCCRCVVGVVGLLVAYCGFVVATLAASLVW